jgi:hypothetical protein
MPQCGHPGLPAALLQCLCDFRCPPPVRVTHESISRMVSQDVEHVDNVIGWHIRVSHEEAAAGDVSGIAVDSPASEAPARRPPGVEVKRQSVVL